MRAYSKYLSHLINETAKINYHLGGSTPPILFDYKKYQSWLIKQTNDPLLTVKIKKEIALRLNCQSEQIVFTPASTQACFQALAAITSPGDTVLIEYPCYEPYLAAADFLGLKVIRYQRTQNFKEDYKLILKQSRKADVMLISNPHCPTGWMYSRQELARLSQLPMKIIVDEVFLPLFDNGKLTQVDLKKSNMISISSLSKSTGFSFIRFGWIAGSQEVVDRCAKMGLHFHSDFPKPILPYAYLAFKNWKKINKQLSARANTNRKSIQKFLLQNPQVQSSHDFKKGFFGILKIPAKYKSAEEFSSELVKQKILIRDASFFEMPEWFRLHLLMPPQDFVKVLKIIVSKYQNSLE